MEAALGSPLAPSRPALRYHGGKWKLAPWVISHFPEHTCYVEPFGGGGSVLLRKPRSEAEIYNDLDDVVVGVFRVLQDPELAERLRRRLVLTPFARREFERCYEPWPTDPVESAARCIMLSFMGVGSDGATRKHKTGFRALRKSGAGTTAATDWGGWPAQVPAFLERLRGVLIECRPAERVIAQFDGPGTLFYVDPPYVQSTRSNLRNGKSKGYRFELSDAGHEALAEQLHAVRGMVVLSGYRSPLYDRLFGSWRFHAVEHRADRGLGVVEGLWLNPAAAASCRTIPLF